MHIQQSYSHTNILVDRLTICFTDQNSENVTKTCNMLKSEHYWKAIPGIRISKNARYAVQAKIPFPHFNGSSPDAHPIFFEAGPTLPKLPSYRLDLNPARLTEEAVGELLAFFESILDCTMEEFFSMGHVTRVDVALDMFGIELDDVIVRSKGKQKHGIYSNRDGISETVYLGAVRSPHRVACYTKKTKGCSETALRLEVRVKPKCLGSALAEIENPLKRVAILPSTALDQLKLGFPSHLLADSIRVRGQKAALSEFDGKDRKAINDLLKGVQNMLPDTDKLWSGWKHAIIMTGFGKELGLLKTPVSLMDYLTGSASPQKAAGEPLSSPYLHTGPETKLVCDAPIELAG